MSEVSDNTQDLLENDQSVVLWHWNKIIIRYESIEILNWFQKFQQNFPFK